MFGAIFFESAQIKKNKKFWSGWCVCGGGGGGVGGG